jgi:hypothetical protein
MPWCKRFSVYFDFSYIRFISLSTIHFTAAVPKQWPSWWTISPRTRTVITFCRWKQILKMTLTVRTAPSMLMSISCMWNFWKYGSILPRSDTHQATSVAIDSTVIQGYDGLHGCPVTGMLPIAEQWGRIAQHTHTVCATTHPSTTCLLTSTFSKCHATRTVTKYLALWDPDSLRSKEASGHARS